MKGDQDMNSKKAKEMGKKLAKHIFTDNSDPKHPTTRIEFKTGSWEDGTEKALGGLIESALAFYLSRWFENNVEIETSIKIKS